MHGLELYVLHQVMQDTTFEFIFIWFICFTAKRLALCEEVSNSKCGNVLFHGYLNTPGNGIVNNSLGAHQQISGIWSSYKPEKLLADKLVQ